MRLRLAIRAMMIVALAAALPAVGARADYPDQTVKVVVPFPAGGFMDVVARIASRYPACSPANCPSVRDRSGWKRNDDFHCPCRKIAPSAGGSQ